MGWALTCLPVTTPNDPYTKPHSRLARDANPQNIMEDQSMQALAITPQHQPPAPQHQPPASQHQPPTHTGGEIRRRSPFERPADDPLLTADEVAALLQVTKAWVYTQTRAHNIPHLTLGRYVRYRRTTVLDWLNNIEQEPHRRFK
jgi:excisionase family DNA binding protein